MVARLLAPHGPSKGNARGAEAGSQTCSAFTGLGSHCAVLRLTGVHFEEVTSAEPKESAKCFMRSNGCMGKHHFDDVRSIIAGQGPCEVCCGTCAMPRGVDLAVGGFSCQPYSPQRAGQRSAVPAGQHPLFVGTELVAMWLLNVEPRMAILENIEAFEQLPLDGKSGGQTGVECFAQAVSEKYNMAWRVLHLEPWVHMNRSRLWIFLVRKDVGEKGLAEQAAALACSWEQERVRLGPPEQLRNFLFSAETAEWVRHVLPSTRPLSQGGRRAPAAAPCWHQQCSSIRAQLKEEGFPDHAAHPAEDWRMRGLSGTEREKEVLEVFYLANLRAQGLTCADVAGAADLREHLFCNISQNPAWLHPGRTSRVPCVCTSTRLFSYGADRVVHPAELLNAMGWQQCDPKGGKPSLPLLGGLQESDLQDLAGECMALPPLALAIWGLLVSTACAFPGLWAGSVAEPGC